MRVLTAHIPVELAGEIDALAERLDRSRAWIVKQALEAYLASQDKGADQGADQVTQGGGFAEAPARFGDKRDRSTGAADMAKRSEWGGGDGLYGRDRAAAAHEQLLALRATTTLGDISWQSLRDTGRDAGRDTSGDLGRETGRR